MLNDSDKAMFEFIFKMICNIDSYQEWLKENNYASILERLFEKRSMDKFEFQ